MQGDKVNEDSEEQPDVSDSPNRAARILQERMRRRHRRASIAKLISYIIALIGVLLLMFWLRRGV
jgi:hypothetical protein